MINKVKRIIGWTLFLISTVVLGPTLVSTLLSTSRSSKTACFILFGISVGGWILAHPLRRKKV